MVFCLDLDGFKEVNDSFGHAAGDAVLVAVARRLRDNVRSLDFISRIGGDEFIILLPVISSDDAEKIAERIIASISVSFDLGLPAPGTYRGQHRRRIRAGRRRNRQRAATIG
jgi:diguanylate cyclase (GGDEF)-like protein